MKVTASSIDFSSLLHLGGIVNSLQPDIRLDNLNSYLYYRKSDNKLYLVIKGSISSAVLEIDSVLEGGQDFAMMVYTDNIVHLMETYTEDKQKNSIMVMESTKDSSLFSFTGNNDKVNFPHYVPTESETKEIASIINSLYSQSSLEGIFDFSLSGEARQYFLGGIRNCLDFIGDDLKNNAVVIYKDRLVVSDNRHVYLYYLTENLPLEEQDFLCLHKKIAKTIIDMEDKGGNPRFIIQSDKQVYVDSTKYKFRAVLNNVLSKVAPPSPADLEKIQPHSKMTSLDKGSFLDILNFFMGFYSSKVSYKTITINTTKNSIDFVRKDTGVSGYNSSHVERKLDTIPGVVGVSCTMLIDSIKSFVKHLTKEDMVDIILDEEHRAVILKANRQEIYLAKLKEK
jgi:hypothetical protein